MRPGAAVGSKLADKLKSNPERFVITDASVWTSNGKAVTNYDGLDDLPTLVSKEPLSLTDAPTAFKLEEPESVSADLAIGNVSNF